MSDNKQLKDKRITIRIYAEDLDQLKDLAVDEGLPYQTFISSILHKVATNRLVDKKITPELALESE